MSGEALPISGVSPEPGTPERIADALEALADQHQHVADQHQRVAEVFRVLAREVRVLEQVLRTEEEGIREGTIDWERTFHPPPLTTTEKQHIVTSLLLRLFEATFKKPQHPTR